ncbi:hypothetical protein POJ06DRAFT_106027 [Lipomyces tetrasporus]|uniref:Uncharacterized protein n=1 Tax=Lipomyces tetrasporus TaxID=54092 RepID=A0AAD7QSK3_9ASCO|nr:uncharacterized protein POJ06DRAFT_106027 [Lipomyces tetrasporus]KAJ8100518.1 hypothetical protein POJ06DRAFT_106027 [Lipomyces tetrasporus]
MTVKGPCGLQWPAVYSLASSFAMSSAIAHHSRSQKLAAQALQLDTSSRALLSALFISCVIPFPAAFASRFASNHGYLSAFDLIANGTSSETIGYLALQETSILGLILLLFLVRRRLRLLLLLTTLIALAIYFTGKYHRPELLFQDFVINGCKGGSSEDPGHSNYFCGQKEIDLLRISRITAFAMALDAEATIFPKYLWLVCQAAALAVLLEWILLELMIWRTCYWQRRTLARARRGLSHRGIDNLEKDEPTVVEDQPVDYSDADEKVPLLAKNDLAPESMLEAEVESRYREL